MRGLIRKLDCINSLVMDSKDSKVQNCECISTNRFFKGIALSQSLNNINSKSKHTKMHLS